MLAQLTIHNYAIVGELQINFLPRMTVITGETGAGKSIAIDALGLCLGERAEAAMVKANTQQATISARFLIKKNTPAHAWLIEHQLDKGTHCLLCRTITADGRSRSFINAKPVALSKLRALGQYLLQIQGQQSYQHLLKSEHQRDLLDQFAENHLLVTEMQQKYHCWGIAHQQLQQQQHQAIQSTANYELLSYQLQELDALSPQPEEYQRIVAEHQQLASAEERLNLSQHILALLNENDDLTVLSLFGQAVQLSNKLVQLDSQSKSIANLLQEAMIQIHEAKNELRHLHEHIEVEPARLDQLEQQIAKTVQLARKHQITPDQLPLHHQKLQQHWQQLAQQRTDHDQLSQRVTEAHLAAIAAAKALSASRQQAAKVLAHRITEILHKLCMPHNHFHIQINPMPDTLLTAKGYDEIQFLITTNPGQPLQPLNKIVSGGELSRIALAIQVITARQTNTPTLIFDEIDSGISGQTALAVGQLLRQLGTTIQLLCVTHLPQVAGCGHQHLVVHKQSDAKTAQIEITPLTHEARLQELARLLGGRSITFNTLANARELLTTE